jgi:hypothetical protein
VFVCFSPFYRPLTAYLGTFPLSPCSPSFASSLFFGTYIAKTFGEVQKYTLMGCTPSTALVTFSQEFQEIDCAGLFQHKPMLAVFKVLVIQQMGHQSIS